MTQEEISEGNKLITSFMGINNDIPHDHQGIYLYHSSWDWLIPCIIKITEICKNNLFNELYEEKWRRLFDYQSYKFFIGDIESIWKATVIFIKWYNEQKEK